LSQTGQLASLVADGAVKGVIGEKKLEHGAAGVVNLIGVGADDHAGLNHNGACRLQLGRLLDLD
jgi:hypothetical protein